MLCLMWNKALSKYFCDTINVILSYVLCSNFKFRIPIQFNPIDDGTWKMNRNARNIVLDLNRNYIKCFVCFSTLKTKLKCCLSCEHVIDISKKARMNLDHRKSFVIHFSWWLFMMAPFPEHSWNNVSLCYKRKTEIIYDI